MDEFDHQHYPNCGGKLKLARGQGSTVYRPGMSGAMSVDLTAFWVCGRAARG